MKREVAPFIDFLQPSSQAPRPSKLEVLPLLGQSKALGKSNRKKQAYTCYERPLSLAPFSTISYLVGMKLSISDKLLLAAGFSEEELRQELALIFYQRGNISMGKAAEFAHMHKIAFQRLLADRKIPLHYDIDDLEEDLNTLDQLDA